MAFSTLNRPGACWFVDARGTNAAPAILTAAPEADKASHSVQASGHANGGVRGDEHTSPARPSLQCKEALPADDKEQSDGLARLASLGSQQSPRASDSLKVAPLGRALCIGCFGVMPLFGQTSSYCPYYQCFRSTAG